MTKRNKRSAVMLVLVLLLVLAFSVPAAADDSDLAQIKLYLRYYEFFEVDEQVYSAKTVPDLMAALKEYDPYSHYFTEAEYATFLNEYDGDYVGIGAFLYQNEKLEVVVMTVFEGSGAAKAGVKSGDIIVSINGQDVQGKSIAEIQQLLMGDGVEGSSVKVGVSRNGQRYDFNITRIALSTPTVSYYMEDKTIGYIHIYQFTVDTAEQVREGIAALEKQGMTSLILDLRDCPGGIMYTAGDTAALFTGVAPTYFTANSWGYQSFYPSDYDQYKLDYPLAVLVNNNTASAAELLTAAIQDWKTGAVIGTGTFGKGVYQASVSLPSGGALYFTVGKYISIGMQDIKEQGGVTPDILVTDAAAQLQAAKNYLSRQVAAAKSLTFHMGSKRAEADGAAWTLYRTSYLANGTSYAPAGEVLTKLGWELNYYNGCWYAFNGTRRLIIDINNQQVISGKFSATAPIRDGASYIPLSILRHVGYTVTWDGTTANGSVRVSK